MNPDPRFLRGVELFNERRFFEAHEAWEALWHETRGADAEFLQGLIQAAVALHHLSRGNFRGARYLYSRSNKRLAQAEAIAKTWALDVRSFLAGLQGCFEAGAEAPVIRLS